MWVDTYGGKFRTGLRGLWSPSGLPGEQTRRIAAISSVSTRSASPYGPTECPGHVGRLCLARRRSAVRGIEAREARSYAGPSVGLARGSTARRTAARGLPDRRVGSRTARLTADGNEHTRRRACCPRGWLTRQAHRRQAPRRAAVAEPAGLLEEVLVRRPDDAAGAGARVALDAGGVDERELQPPDLLDARQLDDSPIYPPPQRRVTTAVLERPRRLDDQRRDESRHAEALEHRGGQYRYHRRHDYYPCDPPRRPHIRPSIRASPRGVLALPRGAVAAPLAPGVSQTPPARTSIIAHGIGHAKGATALKT